MANLTISLLGPPAIHWDGQPVQIQRRQVRGLLYYLACKDKPTPRSELLLVFWADLPDEEARRRLTETLGRLRGDLPDPTLLLLSPEEVDLDRTRVTVDVLEFDELIRRTGRIVNQTPRHTPLPLPTYLDIKRAVDLWRAPQFLAGSRLPTSEEFDNWLTQTAQLLENDRLYLIERLADHVAATGDLESALRWAHIGLQGDDTNIYLNYRILGWLFTLGRRSEAQAQAKVVQELYIGEPGDLPPEIRDLIRKVSRQTKPLRQQPAPAWSIALDTHIPFIGRENELKQLTLAFQRGGAIAIRGESGAGKTRLIYELFQSLEAQPRILLATARPNERNLPFQPLIDALRQGVQPEEWQQLNTTWITHLTRLLPELASLRPDVSLPSRPTGEENRALIFDAVRQLLLNLATGNRLLFFLDDAQWCDEATLAALTYLLERNFFADHGFLILAHRLEETNPHLESLFTRGRGPGAIPRLELALLTPEETSQLTHAMLGQTPSSELTDRLMQDTGGNPLFLIETLRELLNTIPDLDLSKPIDHLPLAGNLRALVRNRLRHLQPSEYNILATAAVIGESFTPELVAAAANEDPGEAALACEIFEKLHLIQSAPSSQPGRFVFVHEKIREALLQDFGAVRRRELHLQVARAFENSPFLPESSRPAILAQHYEAAGQYATAFRYWVQAGEHARQLFSHVDAVFAFQAAQKLLKHLDTQIPEGDIYQLFSLWGEMALYMYDTESALHVYQALLAEGETRSSPWLIGAALSGLGSAYTLLQQTEPAASAFQRALIHLEKAGDPYELMECYNRYGLFMIFTNRYQSALEFYQLAYELGKKHASGRPLEARLNAEYNLSFINTLLGWNVKAEQFAKRCLQNCRAAGFTAGVLRAYAALTLADFFQGKFESGLEYARMGLRLAEAQQSRRLQAFFHSALARNLCCLGHLDDAWQQAHCALQLSSSNPYPEVVGAAYCVLGNIFLTLNSPQQALSYFQQGYEQSGQGYPALENQAHLAIALTALKRFEEAEQAYREVIAESRARDIGSVFLSAEMNFSILLAMLRRDEAAHQQIEITHPEAIRRMLITLDLPYHWAQYFLALNRKNLPDAAYHAVQAFELCQVMPHPSLELKSMTLLAQVNPRLAEPLPLDQERFLHLLDIFDRHTNHPELRSAFEDWRASLVGLIGNSPA